MYKNILSSVAVVIALTLPNVSVGSEVTTITMGGKPMALVGQQLSVNTQAPDFTLVNEIFEPISLADFKGKTVLISAVPSLDTGVCALQTKQFNKSVGQYNDNVVMLTISTDLPFAQKRFCQAEQVDKITVLSDSVWRDFGLKYGLLIKDRGLLARAILIIDANGTLKYKELVAEVANHPDYDAALSALNRISAD
ncbi:thiol peroxidase [Shewanella sp. UCD-KL21]|uniref:thiol peroxidase n=1 Tax=Shewanella sp. UCD-KL21 TaxID=1917164 RepID=UPI0009714CDD|nr:thiol peroxidase [Shewanella sp. UCD-KL21]